MLGVDGRLHTTFPSPKHTRSFPFLPLGVAVPAHAKVIAEKQTARKTTLPHGYVHVVTELGWCVLKTLLASIVSHTHSHARNHSLTKKAMQMSLIEWPWMNCNGGTSHISSSLSDLPSENPTFFFSCPRPNDEWECSHKGVTFDTCPGC